jgi:hypothetical protein
MLVSYSVIFRAHDKLQADTLSNSNLAETVSNLDITQGGKPVFIAAGLAEAAVKILCPREKNL